MKFMQFLSRSKIHVPSDVTIFSFVLDAIRYIHLCNVEKLIKISTKLTMNLFAGLISN